MNLNLIDLDLMKKLMLGVVLEMSIEKIVQNQRSKEMVDWYLFEMLCLWMVDPTHTIQNHGSLRLFKYSKRNIVIICRKIWKMNWIYQTDNDPKHTARVVKNFYQTKINCLKWLTESHDLNPIEMLWIDIEKYIQQWKPKNLEEFYTSIKEA